MLRAGAKYYFSKLDDGEKNLYNRITDALGRFDPALSIHAGMGQDFAVDIQKVLHYALLDNPGLFYLNRNRIIVKQTPMYLQLCFQYDYTSAEAEYLSTEIQQKIVNFMCEYIEADMSPLARQLAVHKYLQSTVTPQKGEPDRDSFSVVGALLRGSCVCEGFAKAYKLLCDYLRLASIVVTGTVSNVTGGAGSDTDNNATDGAGSDAIYNAAVNAGSDAINNGAVNAGSDAVNNGAASAENSADLSPTVQNSPLITHGSGRLMYDSFNPIPHAWNITRINGVTAHTDVTWDTGIGPGGYDYFNLCDADISADHRFDSHLYPKCSPNKINYFYRNGLIAADLNEAKRIIAANGKKDYFSLKLLFPIKREQLGELGFPVGILRFNETQNVVMFSIS